MRASYGAVMPLVAQQESVLVPLFNMANGGLITEVTPDGGKFIVAGQNQRAIEAAEFLARHAKNSYLRLDANLQSKFRRVMTHYGHTVLMRRLVYA